MTWALVWQTVSPPQSFLDKVIEGTGQGRSKIVRLRKAHDNVWVGVGAWRRFGPSMFLQRRQDYRGFGAANAPFCHATQLRQMNAQSSPNKQW